MSDYTFTIGTKTVTLDVMCLYCGQSLEDGREESGYTGEGPDWGSAIDGLGGPERKYGTYLDYGCSYSPDTGDDGTGSHVPNIMVAWDGNLLYLEPWRGGYDYMHHKPVPLTDDDWTTTLPVPAGLLPSSSRESAVLERALERTSVMPEDHVPSRAYFAGWSERGEAIATGRSTK